MRIAWFAWVYGRFVAFKAKVYAVIKATGVYRVVHQKHLRVGWGAGDLVPTKLIDTTFLETASDDWFADFNGDRIAELSVGRLPVRTADEASVVVNKLITYEHSTPSNEVVLVADSNDGFDFEQATTSSAEAFAGGAISVPCAASTCHRPSRFT